MAVVLFMRVPELTPERYGRVMVDLGLDANPPAGLILHAASDLVGAIDLWEIWQTHEVAERYLEERLAPVMAAHGIKDDLNYRIEPLRNVYVPELDILDRIGATSLPLGIGGKLAS